MSVSAHDAVRLFRMNAQIDVRPIKGAKSVLQAIESFMTGNHGSASVDRVLATDMFTDIVDSTPGIRTRDVLCFQQLL